jgi:hypothetical protein
MHLDIALDNLREAERRRQAEDNNVTYWALQARKDGATGQAIGEMLGMSKQAAQKRYDRKLF